MKPAENKPFVTTIKALCRMCYTCVRECPAKAIRIVDGQAEVIPERCIACGNCVRVCSQKAKVAADAISDVEELLNSGTRVAACLAPSFPAEFNEVEPAILAAMVRTLGFVLVVEVGFGADLVAKAYRDLLNKKEDKRYIATTCPAVVGYVERYYPECVESLAPIVSPMVATGRALHQIYGQDLKVVFIGPCIAKKVEADSAIINQEIDEVLTFLELREMFKRRAVKWQDCQASEFDPPHAGAGKLFSLSRGILQAAGITEDLLAGQIVATDGRSNFLEALREFAEGDLDAKLLEVLCCKGCIMGPGIDIEKPLFQRRSCVSRYVRTSLENFDQVAWQASMDSMADLDLRRDFQVNDQRVVAPSAGELADIMARLGKFKPEDELNCGACGYDTCIEHAIAIYRGLAESEMCLPYTIERLRKTVSELAVSNQHLASMQEALMQSEKLASMGQLAAGIAHEVNNPLGIVLMYAHLLMEECPKDSQLREDLGIITQNADRCKRIVSGLLHFARQNKVLRQPTEIKTVIERGINSMPAPSGIVIELEDNMSQPIVYVDGEQVIQVVTNLLSNAYTAMPGGGKIIISICDKDSGFELRVRDNGTGIAPENQRKIFEPFFTTKQMGKGTGLGLAVVYGIIKMHRGSITLESNNDPNSGPTGTTFIMTFPGRDIEEINYARETRP